MLPKGLKLSSGKLNNHAWLGEEYEWYIWIEEITEEISEIIKKTPLKQGAIVMAKFKNSTKVDYWEEIKTIYVEHREWLENLNIREEKLKRLLHE